MHDPSRVRVSGPLQSHAAGYVTELARLGYTPLSAVLQLRLVAHLSRWLEAEGLAPERLSPAVVERFLAARRAAGYTHYASTRAMRPIIEYLHRLGVVAPPPEREPATPLDILLERYRRWRPFLIGWVTPAGLDLERLTAADITAFVTVRCPTQAPGSARLTVTALRSLLGFLHLDGILPRSLLAAVPRVASWRLAGLPKGLEPAEVRHLLETCAQRGATGCRDLAILTLLVRLGLRAGEVARFGLDDVDWRAGELVIRGKGNRSERLPLPADVGEALVDYLRRGRPASAQGRTVFVRVKAPHRAFNVRRGEPGRGRRGTARRPRRAACPPAATHRRDRDAPRRQPAGRDRAGPPPPSGADDRHLRQGRPRGAARPGAPLAGRCGVNRLDPALADYLRLRRALGYKLERTAKLLAQFIAHLDAIDTHTVTIETALAWARLPADGGPSWLAGRLTVVRGFAAYLHAIDPAHQLVPTDLLPDRGHRSTPYLYAEADIGALMRAAATLRTPHRAATYATLLGLLAVSGMRVGEAIRLERGDVDVTHELLTVRNSKFGKSRLVPLHPTTVAALRRYLRRPDRPRPTVPTAAVFVSGAGTRLLYCNVNWTFLRLVRRAGLKARSAACRPRLHDLRHAFAVRSILDAYRVDADVQARLPLLSTYLGHVDQGATYWYLSAAPELLDLAGQRLERHLGGRP